MDLTKQFVTINKNEINKLQAKIDGLVREKKQMLDRIRSIELENLRLKTLITETDGSNSNKVVNKINGYNKNNITRDFIQSQEKNVLNSNISLTPIQTPINENNLIQYNTDEHKNFDCCKAEPENELSVLCCVKNDSNYNSPKKQEMDINAKAHNLNNKQNELLNNVWSFPNSINKNFVLKMKKQIQNCANPTIILTLIAKEWIQKPENMTRTEFFFHLLSIFIEDGVYITYCSEHTPPCKPRVDTKGFERNALILKNFFSNINQMKLIVLEVEILVALENFIYLFPKYRPAMTDLMDIMFRKGLVEAVAFPEWSQIDATTNEMKIRLLREIKASGFSLIMRSSSI